VSVLDSSVEVKEESLSLLLSAVFLLVDDDDDDDLDFI